MEVDVPKIDQFWEDQMVNNHGHSHGGSSGHLQYERNLNFATVALEENEHGYPKKKTVRDPLSHRIIEKRRRDRMNNCLADLARLLPAASLRKGRGRIEKTEIVELAIKHLKHLQTHPCPQSETCEFNQMARSQKSQSKTSSSASSGSYQSNSDESFRLGYQECLSETMHFLVETEGMYAGDATCVRLVKHLNGHIENIIRDHMGNSSKLSMGFPLNSCKMLESSDSFKKGGSPSSSSGYQANGSSSGSDANGGNDGESLGNEPFPLPDGSLNRHCSESERTNTNFDYEGDNNSCSSNPLSIEISDVLSTDGKNANGSSTKPPIPAIIYSGASSNNSQSPALLSSSNGRSSDDGGSSNSNSLPRYKFKNNINKRFNEDLQIKHDTEDSPRQENDVYIEESDQISEECVKMELDTVNMNMSSNSSNSNVDSEPPISSDVTAIANAANSMTVEEQVSATPGNNSRSSSLVPFTPSHDVKKVQENYEEKLGPEELILPKNFSDVADSLILEKKALPLINASTAALFTKNEGVPLPLPGCETTGVPAFALHDKGLYYIPLTIDKSIVSPFIAAMEPNTQPPLHPVTISVCFLLSAAEAEKKFKDSSITSPDKIGLPVPVSVPISIPLPVTVASIAPTNPLMKTPKGIPQEQTNFIMNRFTQSQPQQFNPKVYNSGGGGSNSGYRYPIGMNGSAGSISSGSFSPVSSMITYPLLYSNNPPRSAIKFAQGHNGHSQGSLSSYQSSSHNNYYNNFSSSGSNCSGGNNSDRDSSGKTLRSTNIINDGNKTGSNINGGNSSGNSSNCSTSSSNGNGSSGIGINVHGHTSSRGSRGSGLLPSRGSNNQNRKRSISSTPSVSGSSVSALSSSTGYHTWYEKTPSASSGDSIYSQRISISLAEQQNSAFPDNHYGHHGSSANHLHPHSHGHSHGHSHIHPQYSHGHSHNDGHSQSHHASHYDDKEQGDRTKGRLSPNKRVKKSRNSLESEMQHKHNVTVQGGSIHR